MCLTGIHERVIGQNEAVEAVAKAIRRGRVGLKDPKRQYESFISTLFTICDKTELNKYYFNYYLTEWHLLIFP